MKCSADGFDPNIAAEEITFLSQKVHDKGFSNTYPYTIRRLTVNSELRRPYPHMGLFRVVRVHTGAETKFLDRYEDFVPGTPP